MGRTFVTFEEAANRLGRTKRSVHSYVKNGLLRKTTQDGEVLLHWDDVEQLALDLGADAPAMNRKSFIHLTARIQKLEMDMTVVRRMLEIQDNPYRPDAAEAAGMHKAASAALVHKSWKTEELHAWASYFDRMDEVTFDIFQEVTHLQKPWEVFFRLCLAQMKFVSAQHLETPDLIWQALHKKLDEGRKKIRACALMWIEMGRGTIAPDLLKEVDSDKEDLLKRLKNPLLGGSGG
jgi:hypothetical protein